MKQKNYLIAFICFFLSANFYARDIYVKAGGFNSEDRGTEENPYLTIGYAVGEANSGDTIFVIGTVIESGQILIDSKDLTFQGQSDAIVERSDPGRIILVKGTSDLTFKNIIFQNANAAAQGSVILTTSNNVVLTFEDCLFQKNTNSHINGSVVYIGKATATFTRCTFYNNTATKDTARGVAIIFGGPFTGTITNCTFSENKLTENTANFGAAIKTLNSASQQLTITNSLFSNNTNKNGDKLDIVCASTSNLTIVNSLAESITLPTTFINEDSEIAADFTNTTFTFVSPNLTYTAPTSISDATPIDFGNDNNDVGAWDSNFNLFDGSTDSYWATAANWSSTAIPLATDNVTLLSDSPDLVVDATTGAVANKLSVNASSSLTINSGGSLIVNGSSSGNVTYNVNVIDDKWHLVSSPVAGEGYDDSWANINAIADGSGTNRGISTYQNGTLDTDGGGSDTETGPWVYMLDGESGTFGSGTGYSLKRTSSGTYSFTGTYPTTSATPAITQDVTNWNLIGNPYPSYINIETFLSTNSAKLDGSFQSIYVWNASEDKYDDLATGFVYPGQAFFLNAASTPETVSFTEAMQSHQTGITFYKTENTTVIDLNLTSGESTKSTQINYLENKTTGLDPRFDIGMFDGVASDIRIYTQLISNNEGISFRRQALPNSDYENMVIPIGVKAASGKEITFTAEAMNLPNGVNVFLEDRITDTVTLLNEINASYKVTLNEDTNDVGRFYLHTTSNQVLSTTAGLLENISIYATKNKTLRMIGLPTGSSSVKLFNILGKRVMQSRFISTGMKEISLPKLTTGVYFVHIDTEAGKLNKKIVIE